jgi:hypothetical protein
VSLKIVNLKGEYNVVADTSAELKNDVAFETYYQLQHGI